MRRDPATIFAAHTLDPARCDLYVEGVEDRQFLQWLVGSNKHPKAAIYEIALVDVPGESGERNRVLALAAMAETESARIRCLVDTDFDRLLGGEVPTCCWRTDTRDLEAYFLRPECIEKIWRLGLHRDVDAGAILEAVLSAARPLGVLRLLSAMEGLDLPFQQTSLQGRVSAARDSIDLDVEALARALLQNANQSLTRLTELLQSAEAVDATNPQPAEDVPHGKDCLDLLTEILVVNGVTRSDAHRLIKVSFERWMADEHSVLQEVIAFLETCGEPR